MSVARATTAGISGRKPELVTNAAVVTRFEDSEDINLALSGATGGYDATRKKSGTRSYRIDLAANTKAELTITLPESVNLRDKQLAMAINVDGVRTDYNLMVFRMGNDASLTRSRAQDVAYPRIAQEPNASGANGAADAGDQDSWAYVQWPLGGWVDANAFTDAMAETVPAVKIDIRSTVSQSVWLDEILAIPTPASWPTNGIVSFRFDDGYLSQYQNVPTIFDARSVNYGVYVASDWMDGTVTSVGSDFMTTAQAEELVDAGVEVGVHGIDSHIQDLSSRVEIAAAVEKNRAAVASINGRSDVYVYPRYEARYPASLDILRERRFKVASNGTAREFNLAPPPEPLLVGAQDISEAASSSSANRAAWISRIADKSAWGVFVAHGVVASGATGLQINTTTLATLLDECISAGITVLPLGAVADAYFAYV